MTKSMTGFGSSRYLDTKIEIYCEIKTVNHRFLEISTKPNDLNSELDVYVRDITSKNSLKSKALLTPVFMSLSITCLIPSLYVTSKVYESLKGQMFLLQDFNSNQYNVPLNRV